MNVTIDGWARSTGAWSLCSKPVERSSITQASRRSSQSVNLSAGSDRVVLRTKVKISTSGDFDLRISFSRAEILLMASEALQDMKVSEVTSLLNDVQGVPAAEASSNG